MTDRRRVTEILVSLPDGSCYECLAQKTGLELARVIEAVDTMRSLLATYVDIAICPVCGERRRIVSIYGVPS
jgi:hypothetical protein